ncbi:MAG: DASS family sodium-coupled anion symporter [Pirellulales bacterium]|nr:DASS family sodium-coupled anion symporter [Pirellulales bacterium]
MTDDRSITPVSKKRAAVQWAGLVAGPLLALMTYLSAPEAYLDARGQSVVLTEAARATLAMMVWMAIWWLTEAVEIYVTALLPLATFPLLGVADMKQTATPYAHPLIFLFMGGFLLALSMERWGLGKRLALVVLSTVGSKPHHIIAGFMFSTALLSAFVSNTATTAMMLPIALSIVALITERVSSSEMDTDETHDNFGLCLMLGMAYAASVGGITTIIGTPPNVFLVGFLQETIAEPYRHEISFAEWLLIGVPLAIVFLPIIFFLLTRFMYPIERTEIPGAAALIKKELDSLGRANRGEWATFLVFLCTATLWVTRPWLQKSTVQLGDNEVAPLAGLTDPGIAMMGALVLFVIPIKTKPRTCVMDWSTAMKLPWGILILFGGGLSLAQAVKVNGAAEFIASYAHALATLPPFVIVLIISAGVIFLTELTSNIATTATMLPILAALAPGLGVHPYLLVFPAAIAASCAFMLPVATPPNAIVFGSGRITIAQMCKAGLWINLIGIVLVTLLTMFVVRPLMIDG